MRNRATRSVGAVIAAAFALSVVGAAPSAASRISLASEVRHVVLVDALSGDVGRDFPDLDGEVLAAVSDGHGGWFVGGAFEHVGSVSRRGLARLGGGGRMRATFAPALTGEVKALARQGTVVYAGGVFGVAALDGGTGRRLWMARAAPVGGSASPISGLAISRGVLYAVGPFSRIGGVSRPGVAALDPRTGEPTSWHVGVRPRWSVESVAVTREVVYLGGVFTRLGGAPRLDLGSVSARTGRATAWSPWQAPLSANAADEVEALLVTRGQVLAGGHGFGVVAIPTAAGLGWRRRVHGSATRFAAFGATVYLGGNLRDGFDSIAGRRRNNLAAVRIPGGRVCPGRL